MRVRISRTAPAVNPYDPALTGYLEAGRRAAGERVAEIFRWVFLVVLTIINNLGPAQPGRGTVNLVLAAWAVLNLAITAMMVRRLRAEAWFSLATLVMDLTFGVALIYFSNGLSSPFYLAFFLAIIASSVRFGIVAAVLSALVISFMYVFAGGLAPLASYVHDEQLALSVFGRVFLFLVVALAGGLVVEEVEKQRRIALHRAAQAETLHQMSVAMASSLDVEKVFSVILDEAVRLTGAGSGELLLPEGSELRPVASHGPAMPGSQEPLEEAARRGEATLSPRGEAMVVPIKSGEQVAAVISLRGLPGSFTPDRFFMVNALAGTGAVPLQNAIQYEQRAREAVTDGLTGLVNNREFRRRLEIEYGRYTRRSLPFSLMLVDLDKFKAINDTMGHLHGDHVLKEAARLIDETIRAHDVAARYGGDEFAVIVMDAGAEAARALAERLAERVRAEQVSTVPGATLTFSIGVAGCPDDAITPDELLMAADQALYMSKRDGRDRVTASSEVDGRLAAGPARLRGALMEAGPLLTLAAARALDARRHGGRRHSSRVAVIAEALGRRLGIPPEEFAPLRSVALLHEIDGLGGPDGPAAGVAILDDAGFAPEVTQAIKHLGERWDGRGEPDGLAGDAIPLGSLLVAAADAFDELTSGDGGPALSPAQAAAVLGEQAGTVFDPAVATAAADLVEEGPLAGAPHAVRAGGGARPLPGLRIEAVVTPS